MPTPTTNAKSQAESRTIRVSKRVYDDLGERSRRHHQTVSETIAALLAEQERREFFAQLREGYTALRADETAWNETQHEFAAWDATLGDGLGPEP